jgi:plasmid stability protein
MSKMVQIRNMPDGLHRILKTRAATAGLSLSDYLLRELEQVVQYPTVEELRARLATREAVQSPDSTVSWVREGRDQK